MGRNVKIRSNFVHDATFLNRLKDAIERDPKLTDEFKEKAMAKIQELIVLFHVDYEIYGRIREEAAG
jgi:hypothetical protein